MTSGQGADRSDGFTLAELLVVIAIIGVMTVVGTPYFVSYWQSSKLRAGAEEMATVVNQARQVAIGNNCSVTVSQASNRAQISLGASCPLPSYCASLPCTWRGPGTDGSGNFTLANSVTVTAGTVVFNYLGAATTAGTFTVRNPTNGAARNVVVALSGRVTIQ